MLARRAPQVPPPVNIVTQGIGRKGVRGAKQDSVSAIQHHSMHLLYSKANDEFKNVQDQPTDLLTKLRTD